MTPARIFPTLKRGLALFGVALALACPARAAVPIGADDARLQYTGRIDFRQRAAPVLSWPATTIAGNFTGTSLAIRLDDRLGRNYFDVYIDGDLARPRLVAASRGSRSYRIADDLAPGRHAFLIVKRTEGEEGATVFQGVELADGGELLAPPPRKARRIEFFGDSITSGMGNESPILKARSNESGRIRPAALASSVECRDDESTNTARGGEEPWCESRPAAAASSRPVFRASPYVFRSATAWHASAAPAAPSANRPASRART